MQAWYWEHVCICTCVYLTYKCYIAMEISSRGSTYPEMFCALERFDSAQFLSHAARTHTLPFPRTHSNKTHKHTSTPWTPSFSFFILVYLPLLACLRISVDLSRLLCPSAHQIHWKLWQCPDTTQLSAGRAGHPTPLRATLTLESKQAASPKA